MVGRWNRLRASTWPSPGHCAQWENEQADERSHPLNVSPSLYLTLPLGQTNQSLKEKKKGFHFQKPNYLVPIFM